MDIDRLGALLVVKIGGEMDHGSADGLTDRAMTGLEQHGTGPFKVILDLGDVGMVDSSGLGAIATLWKRLVRAGGDLAVARPPRLAEVMLHRTGLDRYIHIAASTSSAGRHLAEKGGRPAPRMTIRGAA